MDRTAHPWTTRLTLVWDATNYDVLRLRAILRYKKVEVEYVHLAHAPVERRKTFLDYYQLQSYPVLFDRGLVCYGASLDEYLHERFPAPALLPVDPVARAHIRLMAQEVCGWYEMTPELRQDAVDEYLGAIDNFVPFFTGRAPSLVDACAAPVLLSLSHGQLGIRPTRERDYVKRLAETFAG